MEIVLFVELMLTLSLIVIVLLIISLICIKEEKFAKFVMLDVITVHNFSTTVLIVLKELEDLVPHTVTVLKDI